MSQKDFREKFVDFGVRFVRFIPGYSKIKQELLSDWEYAQSFSSVSEFLDKEQETLKKITLGFNYSPPHMEWLINDSRLKDSHITPSPTAVFDWFKSLKLQIGRMEIRIDKSVDDELRFIPTYYTPWLEAFRQRNMLAILNPGLKAARWPEIHISKDILKKIYSTRVPQNGRTIRSKDSLATYVRKYQTEVYSWLKENYLQNIFAIQPENEPHSRFGAYRWKLSDNSLYESVVNAIEFFKNTPVKIMVNSPMVAGMMQKVTDTMIRAVNTYPSEREKLMVGVNHYYRHPHSFVFGTDEIGDTLAFSQLGSLLWGNVSTEKERIESHGIQMMTTELQLEPWYPDWMSPGDNFNEFIFILLRNIKFLNVNSPEKTLILLWGMEEMYIHSVNGLSKEQEMILETVKAINSL